MYRRNFLKSALTLGATTLPASPTTTRAERPRAKGAKKYRAGIVGLGWMGFLYDLGKRDYENIGGSYTDPKYQIDDPNRPLPAGLDVHRKFYFHNHPGQEGVSNSYAEALWDRPEVALVAGAERNTERLRMFGERYGIDALYTDALEMYRKEKLDIVAVCTNTKGRSFLTVKAVEAGAKGILAEKPMTFTLDEADRMVKACADAKVPLVGGATTASHPSFAKAKELVRSGAIGEVLSIEARVPVMSQHQDWSYFLDSAPAWIVGFGDKPRRKRGSTEFIGQGMVVAKDGTVLHIRDGAPEVRLSGRKGEICFHDNRWRLWQDVEAPPAKGRVEMPWPQPQFLLPYRAVYCLEDLIACMEGRMDEPKNSGRRVAVALEVELGLKLSSAQGGQRIDLPLKDRSLGLTYDWFR
ncbi:MAG: Gfo/Idh/MocA family oxidoreductase [Acidimicrobiia bacterium]|nr:Gfo/Idh/MocA family oxidoreductase [Acidimicrobiia bacterium]